MEGHAVTENPMIIMLVNMTVVFLVLIAIGIVIELIHRLDPTKPKQEAVAPPAAVAPAAEQVAPAPEIAGIPPEVIAVISAAVYAMGYSASEVRAVRPLQRDGWKASGMTGAIAAKLRD